LTASKTIYGTKGFRMEREVPSFKEEVRRAETFRNILEECSKHLDDCKLDVP
jgi:hypothetical protein